MDAKTRAHWLMGYGVPRTTVKVLSLAGVIRFPSCYSMTTALIGCIP